MAEPNPTKHVNYNLGMVLGVDDFTQEFAYLSGRDQWLARDLIGYGTVRGLRVGLEVDVTKGPRIAVESGVAVSPRGQLICVPEAQCAYLNDWVEQHSAELAASSPLLDSVRLSVVLCYRDCPTDNVPIAGEPCRSEDQLVAASRLTDDFCLEFRLVAPNQREENAVRDFVAWLRQIDVSDAVVSSTPLSEVLDAIRAAAAEWLSSPPASPPSSPPGDFMFGSPPGFLHIRPEDVCDYMRAAFRVWVTELRPKWIARWHGCAATHFETDDKTEEDCVMLAEVTVPIVAASPGSFVVADSPAVEVDESRRPFVVHLRMLQEWLMCGCACSGHAVSPAGSSPPFSSPPDVIILPDEEPPPPPSEDVAPLNFISPPPVEITRVDSSLTLGSDEQLVVVDTTNAAVVITLPQTPGNTGRALVVKHISGTNACTVARDGDDSIDGKKQVSLTAVNRFIHLVADEKTSTWYVIGND
jgi:hypothetical protein